MCVCVCVFQAALQSIQTGDSPMSGSQVRTGQDRGDLQAGKQCLCVFVCVCACVCVCVSPAALPSNVRLIRSALCHSHPSVRTHMTLHNVALGTVREMCYLLTDTNWGNGIPVSETCVFVRVCAVCVCVCAYVWGLCPAVCVCVAPVCVRARACVCVCVCPHWPCSSIPLTLVHTLSVSALSSVCHRC